MLEPCPICGNPKPLLRRLWSGPYRQIGRRRDYGKHTGWYIACYECHAHLERLRQHVPSLRAARQYTLDAWAQRASDLIQPYSSMAILPCPLCGQPEPLYGLKVSRLFSSDTTPHAFRVLACGRCGFTVAGLYTVFKARFRLLYCHPLSIWNTRISPADFRSWRKILDDQLQKTHAEKARRFRQQLIESRRQIMRHGTIEDELRAQGLKVICWIGFTDESLGFEFRYEILSAEQYEAGQIEMREHTSEMLDTYQRKIEARKRRKQIKPLDD